MLSLALRNGLGGAGLDVRDDHLGLALVVAAVATNSVSLNSGPALGALAKVETLHVVVGPPLPLLHLRRALLRYGHDSPLEFGTVLGVSRLHEIWEHPGLEGPFGSTILGTGGTTGTGRRAL